MYFIKQRCQCRSHIALTAALAAVASKSERTLLFLSIDGNFVAHSNNYH